MRGPLIATEAMGVPVFALRRALLELLPERLPLPFSSHGVSEVTTVLITGVAVRIMLYFALLRTIDYDTWNGMRRTIAMVSHWHHESTARITRNSRRIGTSRHCFQHFQEPPTYCPRRVILLEHSQSVPSDARAKSFIA